MVVVKIEIWPCGDESKAREIGRMNIINDATGDNTIGNYKYELLHGGIYQGRAGFYKEGRIVGFLRAMSPYHLVLKVLKSCL
jgi:hypothetical protein